MVCCCSNFSQKFECCWEQTKSSTVLSPHMFESLRKETKALFTPFVLETFTKTSETCTYERVREIIPFEIFIAFVLLWICWNDMREYINLPLVFSPSLHHHATPLPIQDKCVRNSFQLLHRSKDCFHAVSSFWMTCRDWDFTKNNKKNFSCVHIKGNNQVRYLLLCLNKSLANLQFSRDYFLNSTHEVNAKKNSVYAKFNITFSFSYLSRLIHNVVMVQIWIQFLSSHATSKADYEFIPLPLSINAWASLYKRKDEF